MDSYRLVRWSFLPVALWFFWAMFIPMSLDYGLSVKRYMSSGGNIFIDVISDLKQAIESGEDDQNWNSDQKYEFIVKNRIYIPYGTEWRYYSTRNHAEARLMLAAEQESARNWKLNE